MIFGVIGPYNQAQLFDKAEGNTGVTVLPDPYLKNTLYTKKYRYSLFTGVYAPSEHVDSGGHVVYEAGITDFT